MKTLYEVLKQKYDDLTVAMNQAGGCKAVWNSHRLALKARMDGLTTLEDASPYLAARDTKQAIQVNALASLILECRI